MVDSLSTPPHNRPARSTPVALQKMGVNTETSDQAALLQSETAARNPFSVALPHAGAVPESTTRFSATKLSNWDGIFAALPPLERDTVELRHQPNVKRSAGIKFGATRPEATTPVPLANPAASTVTAPATQAQGMLNSVEAALQQFRQYLTQGFQTLWQRAQQWFTQAGETVRSLWIRPQNTTTAPETTGTMTNPFAQAAERFQGIFNTSTALAAHQAGPAGQTTLLPQYGSLRFGQSGQLFSSIRNAALLKGATNADTLTQSAPIEPHWQTGGLDTAHAVKRLSFAQSPDAPSLRRLPEQTFRGLWHEISQNVSAGGEAATAPPLSALAKALKAEESTASPRFEAQPANTPAPLPVNFNTHDVFLGVLPQTSDAGVRFGAATFSPKTKTLTVNVHPANQPLSSQAADLSETPVSKPATPGATKALQGTPYVLFSLEKQLANQIEQMTLNVQDPLGT